MPGSKLFIGSTATWQFDQYQHRSTPESYSFVMSERLDKADSPAALAEQELRERDVIALVAALVRELHPQRIRFIDVLPSSRIERDLGIDSLGSNRTDPADRARIPRAAPCSDHWRGGDRP